MACAQRSCQNFNWDTILWPTDLCTFGFLHVFACKRDILEKTFIFNFARPLIRSETSQRGLATSTIRPSYCLFGSKKHMMGNIFQNRRMPFYMFGDTLYLKPIPTKDWVPFIQARFASKGTYRQNRWTYNYRRPSPRFWLASEKLFPDIRNCTSPASFRFPPLFHGGKIQAI